MRQPRLGQLFIVGTAWAFPFEAFGKPVTDAEAAHRIERAKDHFASGKVAAATHVLERLIKERPEDANASTLLCVMRTAEADAWEYAPVDPERVLARFKIAADACARASRLETAPEYSARKAWAHAAVRIDDAEIRIAAYEAWSTAQPNDATALGGLAAWLEASGRRPDADAALARAQEGSPAFLQRVRFEFACRIALPAHAARVIPMLDAMSSAESLPEGQAMIGVLRASVERGLRGGLLALLDLIDRRTLSDANAHRLWTCLADDVLPTKEREATAPPGYTLPVARSKAEPKYPWAERGARREGRVIALARITASGAIDVVWIARSAGAAFDASATQALKRWTYAPGTMKGKPVPWPFIIRVDFRMRR